MHTGFKRRNLKGTERDQFEELGLDTRIILKQFFKCWNGREWIGFIGFMIEANGRLLLNMVMDLQVL
jgi:hypothetical protein